MGDTGRVGRIRVEDRAGQTVVVKSGGPSSADALRREAAWLERLRHPGVVELVALDLGDGDDTQLELHTVFAGSLTLADLDPRHIGQAVTTMASLAAVVADLHQVGVAHNAITGDHVILGPMRHPVLCSFGAASPATPEGVAGDLGGIELLLDELVERVPEPGDRRTRRRDRRVRAQLAQRRGARSATELASALAAVATTFDASATRLPAHAAGAPPESEVPAARTTDASDGTRTWRDRVTPPFPPTRDAATRWPWAAALVGTMVLLATVVIGRSDARRPPSAAPPAAPLPTSTLTAADTPATSHPTARTPSADATRSVCPVSGSERNPEPGCSSDVEVVGNLIRVDAAWFEAGRPGDVAAVGDWDCDGHRTPALLRPATGEIFVFTRWASDVEPVQGGAVATIPGASALRVTADGACDRLHAADQRGRLTPVDVTRTR